MNLLWSFFLAWNWLKCKVVQTSLCSRNLYKWVTGNKFVSARSLKTKIDAYSCRCDLLLTAQTANLSTFYRPLWVYDSSLQSTYTILGLHLFGNFEQCSACNILRVHSGENQVRSLDSISYLYTLLPNQDRRRVWKFWGQSLGARN